MGFFFCSLKMMYLQLQHFLHITIPCFLHVHAPTLKSIDLRFCRITFNIALAFMLVSGSYNYS